jgi:predicted transcriptional regulator
MFCGQLIAPEIPVQRPTDAVGTVLRQMEESRVQQLPVSDGEKYLGLVSEDDLLDEREETVLSTLQDRFNTSHAKVSDYFLVAARLMHVMDLDLVPVLNEKGELEGVITQRAILHELARKTGSEEYGSMVVLEMQPKDYSVGEMSRLVESNDAIITQLNTWADPATHLMNVIVRINKSEISDIVATFQRHDFHVRYYQGEELFRNELQTNLDHLMNYLNI